MDSCVKQLRKRLAKAGKTLVKEGLTSGSSGNISAKISNSNKCLIKPSGRRLDRLLPEDFIVMDINSLEHSGTDKPSIEAPFHTELYKNSTKIGAIVHVHSRFALILSVSSIVPIPMSVEIFNAPLLAKGVGISDFAVPGSKELAFNVVQALDDKRACLMPHHGSITIGSTIEEAVTYSQVLEKICELNYFVRLIGKPVKLPLTLLEELKNSKPGKQLFN